jgi:hypothetical protein
MIANDTYKLEGSRQEMATLLRCSVGDLNLALPSLKASDAGDVTLESNGYVTLASRRLKRECIARENGRKRQSKFRDRGGGNATKPSVSVSASDSESESPEGGLGETGGAFHDLKREIHVRFKREPGERWDYEEERLLFEICKSPTAIHEYHTIIGYGGTFPRQSVLSLLQNWKKELDKARNFKPDPKEALKTGNSGDARLLRSIRRAAEEGSDL